MKLRNALLAFFAASLVTLTANSTTEAYTAVAKVTSAGGLSDFAVGDLLTVNFSYDTTSAYGEFPSGCCISGYWVPDFAILGERGGYEEAAAANFYSNLASITAPGNPQDPWGWRFGLDLTFGPNYLAAIPPAHMDTSALLYGSLTGSLNSVNATGNFSADVQSLRPRYLAPIPASAVLFGSGLLLLALRPRRRLLVLLAGRAAGLGTRGVHGALGRSNLT
jgi:hypothetical protein